ncbi:MAG: serine hydrolase [Actinobacteria bacterium]|nr:serine hydrolase [Actinomycetota bacterium]
MISAEGYFPLSESAGGWRQITGDDQLMDIAGISGHLLRGVADSQQRTHAGFLWSIVVVLRGHVVLEVHSPAVLASTRFDLWSGTKSFTATAWGILLDSLRRDLPMGEALSLDDPIYDLIPGGIPLTDPNKADITLRHLLSMTSGIPGEKSGLHNTPTSASAGAFEHALGRSPNRHGKWAAELSSTPGTAWDYSDPAYLHLSPLFKVVAGCEIAEYMQTQVFAPIGVEQASWDAQGGGDLAGPHTVAQTGLHVSVRDLARFGYLMLHRGVWGDRRLVPDWWIDESTRPSQPHNPEYGLGWWVNSGGTTWPSAPLDTFALAGMLSNRCYVLPSLELVIARVGNGPQSWNDRELLDGVLGAMEPNAQT